jgi:hypothetical protein
VHVRVCVMGLVVTSTFFRLLGALKHIQADDSTTAFRDRYMTLSWWLCMRVCVCVCVYVCVRVVT